jgi:hypothetical protein
VVHKVEKSRVGKFKTDTIKKRNNNVDWWQSGHFQAKQAHHRIGYDKIMMGLETLIKFQFKPQCCLHSTSFITIFVYLNYTNCTSLQNRTAVRVESYHLQWLFQLLF